MVKKSSMNKKPKQPSRECMYGGGADTIIPYSVLKDINKFTKFMNSIYASLKVQGSDTILSPWNTGNIDAFFNAIHDQYNVKHPSDKEEHIQSLHLTIQNLLNNKEDAINTRHLFNLLEHLGMDNVVDGKSISISIAILDHAYKYAIDNTRHIALPGIWAAARAALFSRKPKGEDPPEPRAVGTAEPRTDAAASPFFDESKLGSAPRGAGGPGRAPAEEPHKLDFSLDREYKNNIIALYTFLKNNRLPQLPNDSIEFGTDDEQLSHLITANHILVQKFPAITSEKNKKEPVVILNNITFIQNYYTYIKDRPEVTPAQKAFVLKVFAGLLNTLLQIIYTALTTERAPVKKEEEEEEEEDLVSEYVELINAVTNAEEGSKARDEARLALTDFKTKHDTQISELDDVDAVKEAYNKLSPAPDSLGGGSKKLKKPQRRFKGGFQDLDAAKMYNAQGLVTSLDAALSHQVITNPSVYPNPFSAGGLTQSSDGLDANLASSIRADIVPSYNGGASKKKKRVSSARK